MKVETTKFKVMIDCSPSTRLSEVVILLLDEEKQEKLSGCDFLSLEEQKEFWCFDDLTLDDVKC